MYLPLSRQIPLRDTTVWGRFASIEAIPRVYGKAVLAPVPYNDTGRLFVLADHPIQGVVAVQADGAPVTAWRFYHAADSTGRTVAFLELQTPVQIGTTRLAAEVEGMRHPVTGGLMCNPADVAQDLLQWVTGQAVDGGRFALFAAACDKAGMEVHGALIDKSQTARGLLDSIMDSAKATWSSSYAGFAMLWPDMQPVTAGGLLAEDGTEMQTETGEVIYA